MKTLSWKPIVILAAIILSIIFLLPTFFPGLWPYKKINLGLDLQGGMHLVLQADTNKLIENDLERFGKNLEESLREENIPFSSITQTGENQLIITGNLTSYQLKSVLKKPQHEGLELVSSSTQEDIFTAKVSFTPEVVTYLRDSATDQALETIRNRIDQFGVAEPDVRKQGEGRIQIQLPGVTNPETAKELIGRTAQLEFKLVDASVDPNGLIPEGREVLYETISNPATGDVTKIPMVLKKNAALTGTHLKAARVAYDNKHQPYVHIEFDNTGARLFDKITGENIGKSLVIVLDNEIYSAPIIQDRISGGQASITGRFTTEEASLLAIALRSGALPVPVKIIEERTVGPSLGSDSIRQGVMSTLIGGFLLGLFICIYYRGAGVIATFCLFLNVLFVGGALAALQATLTLPGIAGIILTIGMAVDANVLIFERIREEWRNGKTPRAAVDAGFDRATLTILDANITTLIAAAVLFQFGTGPIKGFAVTLVLGILASMFTALIVSRYIFDFLLSGRKVEKLSI